MRKWVTKLAATLGLLIGLVNGACAVYADSNPLMDVAPDGLQPTRAGRPLENQLLEGGAGIGGPASGAGGAGAGRGTMGLPNCPPVTSDAARREVMREVGIPTSQQPISQSRNASGREYSYEVPAPGGSTQIMSVQQQTMDRSHLGQPHWEAGRVKIDKETGAVLENAYGRPALRNGKAKVNY